MMAFIRLTFPPPSRIRTRIGLMSSPSAINACAAATILESVYFCGRDMGFILFVLTYFILGSTSMKGRNELS